MKKLYFILLLSIIISCNLDKNTSGEITNFIPENTAVLLKITNTETLKSDIRNNAFLLKFSKTNGYKNFENNLALLNYISPISEVLLCFSKDNDTNYHYTFITKEAPNLFNLDSLQNVETETIPNKKQAIIAVTIENETIFTSTIDSVFIASSSQNIIESLFAESNKKPSTLFNKLYETLGDNDFSVCVQGKEFSEFIGDILPKSTLKSHTFSGWTALNTSILPNSIRFSGISISNDSIPQLIDVFKGTVPQQNTVSEVTPTTADGLLSLTFRDYNVFKNNLKSFQKNNAVSNINDDLFQSVNELGVIYLNNEKALVLKATDPLITKDYLIASYGFHNEIRGVEVSTFSDTNRFENSISPFVDSLKVSFVFQLENHFIFTNSEKSSEDIITQYRNNVALAKQPYYIETREQLSDASSILFVSLNENFKQIFASYLPIEDQKKVASISFEDHKIAAFQLSYDMYFSHINGIIRQSKQRESATGILELFSIKLEHPLLKNPQFFTNHRSKGKDIIAQDITNTLHFISANGKILWKKKLDGAVLGKVQEVDLLRNGKKQLAFATKNTFYVLDRNGKVVSPFSLKFKDAITQPLAIFDYDKNRKYRFIITQGKNVLMYDSKAKIVKGFKFKNTQSPLVFSPKHIRMGSKDYIVIAEKNGKLSIINRVGKERINVDKTFVFSENQITVEEGSFIVITKNNTKETISQSGKITTKNLSVAEGFSLLIEGKTKVTLDENLLRINEKLVELPFGIYSSPSIFRSNRKIYISVTDQQENKVYLFDSYGALLPNFPIYGTSSIDLGDATRNKKANIVVQGSEGEIILYER